MTEWEKEIERTVRASESRIVNLEQQVANQAGAMKALAQIQDSKTLSAQQPVQKQNPLYAPLRSDTKPLLEMSAFVRKVAGMSADYFEGVAGWHAALDVIAEAQEILKRST